MRQLLYFLFFFSLFAGKDLYAQTNFQRLIGGVNQERGQTLFETQGHNYIYNGVTTSFGFGIADPLFMKTDDNGLTIWTMVYGTPSYDNSEFALLTYDNNLVATGRTQYPLNTNNDALLFKIDSIGHLMWSNTYGGSGNDGIAHMIETSDHGYALVGATQSIGAGLDDILLIRTDENGDTIFTRSYGTALSEIGSSIVQLSDGGFVLSGKQIVIRNGFPYADGILMRTDAGGNLLWTQLYGDSLWEEFACLKITLDSGIIACGTTVTFGAGTYDIFCLKTNSEGVVQWSKTFGGLYAEAAYGVLVNPDTTYVLSGYTNSMGHGHVIKTLKDGNTNHSPQNSLRVTPANPVMLGDDSTNIFLMKLTSSGDTIWTRSYGDGLMDEAYRNEKTSDGGYMVSGFTYSYDFADSSQMLMIKTDSLGFTGCHEETAHPHTDTTSIVGISVIFTESSGLTVTSIPMSELLVNARNDDACLFTQVNSTSITSDIPVFPNPFFDKVTIQPGVNFSAEKIEITDLFGKLIYSSAEPKLIGAESIILDLSFLTPGIYVIKLTSSEQMQTSKKIIKM